MRNRTGAAGLSRAKMWKWEIDIKTKGFREEIRQWQPNLFEVLLTNLSSKLRSNNDNLTLHSADNSATPPPTERAQRESNGRSSWEVTEGRLMQSKIVVFGGWWLKIYFQSNSSDKDNNLHEQTSTDRRLVARNATDWTIPAPSKTKRCSSEKMNTFEYSERESNPHGHYWPQDFKSGVSTYSTIRALFCGANVQLKMQTAKWKYKFHLKS